MATIYPLPPVLSPVKINYGGNSFYENCDERVLFP